MTDAKLLMQDVIQLRVQAALTAIGYADAETRVVMNPVHGQSFPYVAIGDDEQRLSTMATDQTSDANELNHWVRIFSRDPVEVKTLGAEIIARLTDRDDRPVPAGWQMYVWQLGFDQIMPELTPDGIAIWARHLRFEFELEPIIS